MLLWVAFACTEPAAQPDCSGPFAATVTPSDDVVTVATVAWTGDDSTPTRAEIHDDEGGLLASEFRSGGAQLATLIGLPPASDLLAKITDESGSVFSVCPLQTGPLPTDMPSLQLSGEPGWDGLLATSFVGSWAAPVVIDERGTIRWYYVEDIGLPYRTRFRTDGLGIRYLYEHKSDDYYAYVADLPWAGGEPEILSGNTHPSHDFVTLDDGTIGIITSYQFEELNFDKTGNMLVERAPDGTLTELWNAQDSYFPGGVPEGADITEYWSHGNALKYDADRDAWWFGFRNLNSIVIISRQTGETLERLGGDYSDYTFADGAKYSAQHEFEFTDDGILLHDNRQFASESSRVSDLSINFDSKVISLKSSFVHDPPVWVYAMGEPIRLDDGTTLVVWSSAGLIDDVAPDGSQRATLAAEFTHGLGYIEYHTGFPGQVELR